MQFSHFLVSMSMILMSANYLLEGKYLEKIKFVGQHKTILFFVGLFVLHIIGLLWTDDVSVGLRDIEKKLPLFALSMAIGATKKISRTKFDWALLFFIATSITSSIIGSVIYFEYANPGDDYRNMSPFLSHIRLSLMMGVAMFSSIYLALKSERWQKYKVWFWSIAIWFLVYLFMLRAMSGIVSVMISVFVLVWVLASRRKLKFSRTIKLAIVGLSLSVVGYVYWQVDEFYTINEIDITTVDQYTVSGEKYWFETDFPLIENGNYVHSFIAKDELKEAWNTHSKFDFNGEDLRGQPISSTIIRYLTSKGLRKDKEGVQALTHLDIWAIENGLANERYLDSKNLNTMMYRYIWEIHNYSNGFNPQGNSLGQRVLFWKLGLQIFKENKWFGVGTGDVQASFDQKYEELPYFVKEKYRLRAHQQYLTMGITFGLIGLIYFLWTFLSGFLEKENSRTYLFLGFFIIMMVSMLDEDLLESQFGVTFAMYFFFLFLFHHPDQKEIST